MSFLFGWFWSDKPVDQEEADRAAQVQRALFQEMHEVFEYNDLSDFAERKYDYEIVYDTLTEILERVDEAYKGSTVKKGKWVFPTDDARQQCKKLSEEYLDTIVRYKDFVNDNTVLKLALAKKILSFAELEQFFFDWHYWQLFRRHLQYDLHNQDEALLLIEQGEGSSSDEESWDTDDE